MAAVGVPLLAHRNDRHGGAGDDLLAVLQSRDLLVEAVDVFLDGVEGGLLVVGHVAVFGDGLLQDGLIGGKLLAALLFQRGNALRES